MPLPISRREVTWATAARRTGPLRQKRSLLTQSWSKPACSAARARATYCGIVRSLLRRRLKRIARADHRLGFDLDEVGLPDQRGLDQRVGGADVFTRRAWP